MIYKKVDKKLGNIFHVIRKEKNCNEILFKDYVNLKY